VSLSTETLELALTCVEGAVFTIASAELDEMNARVATALRELTEAIAAEAPEATASP